MQPIDHAWALLKQVAFEDVGPLPEQIRGSPSQLPGGTKEPYTRDANISEEEFRNRFMKPGTLGYTHDDFDESYMHEQLYPALEREATRQASQPATSRRPPPP